MLIAVLFLSAAVLAQTESTHKKLSAQKQVKLLCKQQINFLKNNALVVRLQTKKNSIEALIRSGKYEKADKLLKEQNTTNALIISAFKSSFNFCPVYFVLSNNSALLADKQFDKLTFLNDNMQPDTTIKFAKKDFLLAEFTVKEQDTAKYFDGYYDVHTKNGIEKQPRYYGSSDMGVWGLVVKSEQFVQLRHPFPYFVRMFSTLPLESGYKRTVAKLNSKLDHYYKRMNK